MEHIRKTFHNNACLLASAMMVAGKTQKEYEIEERKFVDCENLFLRSNSLLGLNNRSVYHDPTYKAIQRTILIKYNFAARVDEDNFINVSLYRKGFHNIFTDRARNLLGKGILTINFTSIDLWGKLNLIGGHAVAFEDWVIYDPDCNEINSYNDWHKRITKDCGTVLYGSIARM